MLACGCCGGSVPCSSRLFLKQLQALFVKAFAGTVSSPQAAHLPQSCRLHFFRVVGIHSFLASRVHRHSMPGLSFFVCDKVLPSLSDLLACLRQLLVPDVCKCRLVLGDHIVGIPLPAGMQTRGSAGSDSIHSSARYRKVDWSNLSEQMSVFSLTLPGCLSGRHIGNVNGMQPKVRLA